MKIGVLGAGAFGTAMAITLTQSNQVMLWSRDADHADQMMQKGENVTRLPGIHLPQTLSVTSDFAMLEDSEVLLLCVPMQKLRGFLEAQGAALCGKPLVACCKGIELKTGLGPLDILSELCPNAPNALLTGPSFAQDIANGLPTALTLACADPDEGKRLQHGLSNDTLRLYRSTDVIGASLGGAVKNVIAIACGAVMGVGLGESARAAVMTRGNAEMQRLAAARGADPATLAGLSGFGDLVLTCTSTLSRNYRFGLSIGNGEKFDHSTTVEGAATAVAIAEEAQKSGLDLPISCAVAALVEKRLDVADAIAALLSRSLKEE